MCLTAVEPKRRNMIQQRASKVLKLGGSARQVLTSVPVVLAGRAQAIATDYTLPLFMKEISRSMHLQRYHEHLSKAWCFNSRAWVLRSSTSLSLLLQTVTVYKRLRSSFHTWAQYHWAAKSPKWVMSFPYTP